jgi:hypothetical protein
MVSRTRPVPLRRFLVPAAVILLSQVACGPNTSDSEAQTESAAPLSAVAASSGVWPDDLIAADGLSLSAGVVTGGQILLYDGAGASSSDVAALEAILFSLSLKYDKANETDMNDATEAQLKTFKLILWPGGNSITMQDALKPTTTALVHQVVLNDEVHYMGICAGAFIGGWSSYGGGGFNLTGGVYYDFYSAYPGILYGMEQISIAGSGTKRDLVWWEGPQLSGHNGSFGFTVAKYPTGVPAIVEHVVGTKGFVLLSGVHPEAPESWRETKGFANLPDTDGYAPDVTYAKVLITAALNGALLTHY